MTTHDHDREVEMFGLCVHCAARHVDPNPARRARDQAIEQVKAGADAAWIDKARAAVRRVAAERDTFTTDDVWQAVPAIDEPRAMGAVMTWAVEHGVVARTEATRPSTRPQAHARPVRVWRSLTFTPPSLF